MKSTLKEIIEKSGKNTKVSYLNKEKRVTFDESFGKSKMELARKIIGENSVLLSKKLSRR
jgi:carbon monoxide dehydrogenase subunit G